MANLDYPLKGYKKYLERYSNVNSENSRNLMKGKDKCRILKDVRCQVAEANDIDLQVSECTHQGPCRGTCPRCESEVRQLEDALNLRRSLGRKVVVAGVAALALANVSCNRTDLATDADSSYEEHGEYEGYVMLGEPVPESEPEVEPEWQALSTPDGSVVVVPKDQSLYNSSWDTPANGEGQQVEVKSTSDMSDLLKKE